MLTFNKLLKIQIFFFAKNEVPCHQSCCLIPGVVQKEQCTISENLYVFVTWYPSFHLINRSWVRMASGVRGETPCHLFWKKKINWVFPSRDPNHACAIKFFGGQGAKQIWPLRRTSHSFSLCICDSILLLRSFPTSLPGFWSASLKSSSQMSVCSWDSVLNPRYLWFFLTHS